MPFSCIYDISVGRPPREAQAQEQLTQNEFWHGPSLGAASAQEAANQHDSSAAIYDSPSWRLDQDYVGPSRELILSQEPAGLSLPPGQDTDMMPNGSSPDWEVHNPMALLGQHPGRSSLGQATHQWLDGVSLDLEAFDNSMFRASRMDWLGCETDFSDQHTLPPMSAVDHPPAYGATPPGGAEIASRTMSIINNQLDPTPPETGQPQPGVGSQDKKDKTTWPGILDRGGNELWPFDYASNKGFRKIRLPPLREVLEQTVGHLPAIETSTVKDLIRVLSAPLIPSLNDSPALEALPAVAFLGQLVKIYFAEFHPALPIIHVPTWRIEKCPNALLAAMACIGSTYSTAEGSQEVAALLAEITQRTLFWMGQADSRSFRNPSYIAASCLHQIYALGSGNRRLYELADASRGLLVTGLRELGVLSSDLERSESSKIDYQGLKQMDAAALEQAWSRWRDIEIERRVAWSVFEFDSTLSTLTSKRGAFSISELPTKLPCAESLWDAPSANAWASVVSFSASPPDGIPFYPLLRSIIARKTVSNSVPAWAQRICVLVISRVLWDLRELEDASSPDVVGLSSLADSHKATRENLLASMTALSDSLSRPTCTYDVINMNVASLATHFAYMSSSDETMDLVTFIFRNNYAWNHGSTSQLNKELTRAREQLRLRFQHNPIATRRSVHHAALIVGISRECTSFTPCETMRVFFSLAFLLAFARFFPFENLPPPPQIDGPSLRLDELPRQHSQPSNSSRCPEVWIEYGGPASLGPVDDICQQRNFQPLKEIAVKTMESLRVWGLAKKFYRILRNFNYD
ncbi:hypothetical protein Plec18170_007059 [Paecilomyces lecythidis]